MIALEYGWWSKGNIDGTVPKIQRVEKGKKVKMNIDGEKGKY